MKTKINQTITNAIFANANKYPCIQRIGVFGSYARGDFANTSDIDFLYDYDINNDDSVEQILSFMDDLSDEIKPLDTDFIYLQSVLKRDDEFKQSVLNDVIWIYEGTN